MFINFSNHPSTMWLEKQLAAAHEYGEIVDVPFPAVPATATEDDVELLAQDCYENIKKLNPEMVMCSGEFSLTYAVLQKLLADNITCVCACSERNVTEKVNEDGTVTKVATFEFKQFRRYR